MSRYPENPDPDRSGSWSRTDPRADPEPNSGLNIFFFLFFAKPKPPAPRHDVRHLYGTAHHSTLVWASAYTDWLKKQKTPQNYFIFFFHPDSYPELAGFRAKNPEPDPELKIPSRDITRIIYAARMY